MIATLDRHERVILQALQDNGRLTMQELAERAGLSVSPCWRRVKSLEEIGVIRKYTALVDPIKLGYSECIFANVTLERHAERAVENFEKAMLARPEVLDCFAVTGDADYMMRVIIESTQAYGEFLHRYVFTIPGVSQVRSNISLRQIKNETELRVDPMG